MREFLRPVAQFEEAEVKTGTPEPGVFPLLQHPFIEKIHTFSQKLLDSESVRYFLKYEKRWLQDTLASFRNFSGNVEEFLSPKNPLGMRVFDATAISIFSAATTLVLRGRLL